MSPVDLELLRVELPSKNKLNAGLHLRQGKDLIWHCQQHQGQSRRHKAVYANVKK